MPFGREPAAGIVAPRPLARTQHGLGELAAVVLEDLAGYPLEGPG